MSSTQKAKDFNKAKKNLNALLKQQEILLKLSNQYKAVVAKSQYIKKRFDEEYLKFPQNFQELLNDAKNEVKVAEREAEKEMLNNRARKANTELTVNVINRI